MYESKNKKIRKIQNDADAMLMTLVPMWNQIRYDNCLHAEHYRWVFPPKSSLMLDKISFCWPKANLISVEDMTYIHFSVGDMPGNKMLILRNKKKFSWMIPERFCIWKYEKSSVSATSCIHKSIIIKWRNQHSFSIIHKVRVWARRKQEEHDPKIIGIYTNKFQIDPNKISFW